MNDVKSKILIIDDDPVLSNATCNRLKKRGYDVQLCRTGKKGVEEALSGIIDLVLLDIKMPEFSGLEVLSEIRKTKEQNLLPIIMVTSCEEDDDIIEALKLGANDYVTKPVNIEVLVARIKTQLDVKSLSLEHSKQQELKAMNAMITTYNHEINNPLTIAFLMLDRIKAKHSSENVEFEKLHKSLVRVKDIVKKISKITDESSVNYTDYTSNSKMINLK